MATEFEHTQLLLLLAAFSHGESSEALRWPPQCPSGRRTGVGGRGWGIAPVEELHGERGNVDLGDFFQVASY